MATATWVGTDATTRGDWVGVYGGGGYNLVFTSALRTSGAGTSASWSGLYYDYGSPTSDTRGLRDPLDPTNGAARSHRVNYDSPDSVTFTTSGTQIVGLYCVDWDSSTRIFSASVYDAGTNALLDGPRTINVLGGGVYARWTCNGNCRITVSLTAGVNVTLGGLFFDSAPPPPPPATVLLEEPRVAAARRRPSPLFEPPLMTPAARPPLGWEPAPASPLAPGRRQRPPALDLPALPTARLAGWEPALDRQARRRAAAPPVTGDALPAAPTVWLDSLSGDSRRPAPPRRTAEPDPPAPPPPTTTTPAAWHELVGPARVAPARPRPSLWWPEIVPATPGPTRVFRGTAALPVTVAAPPLTLTSLAAPRVWAGTARQIMGPGSFSLEYTPGEDVTLDLTHADNLDPRSWTQAMYMAPWGGGTPQLTGATYTVLGTVPPFVTRWTIPRVDTLRQGVGYWLAQVKRIDSGNNVVLSTGKVNVTQTSQG